MRERPLTMPAFIPPITTGACALRHKHMASAAVRRKAALRKKRLIWSSAAVVGAGAVALAVFSLI